MLVLKNLLIDEEIKDIVCKNGIITKVGKTNTDGIDFHGLKAFSGLVDIHTHGICGIDTMDCDLDSLSKYQALAGTTSYLPTTVTESNKRICDVLKTPYEKSNGANILGFHIEGPYINIEYAGAQNSEYIRKPDINEFKNYESVKMYTIAPELDGAMDFIESTNAIISLGHSNADYETANKAFDAGAQCLTHTYNAMKPIHHRNPGMIGSAFDSGKYVQLICDGIHIHPSVVRMTYAMFGSEKVILISDSMRATGLPDGQYDLGGLDITVKNGIARTNDGALAGSTTTLLECVKSAICMGIPESEAFKMATETPAKLLGVNKGCLKEGYDADIIITDDKYNLKYVIINGKLVKGDE